MLYPNKTDEQLLNMNLYYWELGCAMYLDCPDDPAFRRVKAIGEALDRACAERELEMAYDPIGNGYVPIQLAHI